MNRNSLVLAAKALEALLSLMRVEDAVNVEEGEQMRSS